MRILLVAPLFRPNKGVSVKRLGYFYDKLSLEHNVDILTFADKNFFQSNKMTIKKSYFYPFIKSKLISSKVEKILSPILIRYNLVIVSVPDFGLIEIIHICKKLGIKTLIDLRDQPDLDYYEYQARYKVEKFLYYFYNKLLQIYVYRGLKKADFISVVGAISTSIVQERLKDKNIFNIHNGFFEEDRKYVQKIEYNKTYKKEFTIGWVGNIYRFRDTKMLREMLLKMDMLALLKPIVIEHFGSLNDNLKKFIDTKLLYLKYRQTQDNDRKSFLMKLSHHDMFLLSCSDKLIWEPTTTVFDYILFDKPVLFSGLKNNEAFNILFNCGLTILDKYDIDENMFNQQKTIVHRDISLYSRDFSYKSFNKILVEVERDKT